MPQSLGSILSIVRRCVLIPARESSNVESIILFRYWRGREIHHRCIPTGQIACAVRWDVIRKADLVWLVDVQHVDLIIP